MWSMVVINLPAEQYIFLLFIRLFIDIDLFDYLSDSVLVYPSIVTQSGAKCNAACSTC